MHTPQSTIRSSVGDERVHPGRVLLDLWMHPYDISQNELARMMGVSARRVNEIVHGRRAITADSAVRLSHAFGISAYYWLALQADHEIHRVEFGPRQRIEAPRRMRPLTDEERDRKRVQAMVGMTAQHADLRPFILWDSP